MSIEHNDKIMKWYKVHKEDSENNGPSIWGFTLYINPFAATPNDHSNPAVGSAVNRIIELTEALRDSEYDPDTRYIVESWPSNCIQVITTTDKTQIAIELCQEQNLGLVDIRPIYS